MCPTQFTDLFIAMTLWIVLVERHLQNTKENNLQICGKSRRFVIYNHII